MKGQQNTDFDRIADAIFYLRKNFKTQPSLEDVAGKLKLSPHHFQRMFTDWAGVSPKKFLQYTTLEYAKSLLKETGSSLLDIALDSGLSGTGRLHDLFINIEGMTPGEYKNGGKDLSINYSYAECPFGKLLVASTPKGICYISFFESEKKVFQDLKSIFPNATYNQTVDMIQQNALFIFTHDWSQLSKIKLHLKGTDFQLKVWETLLKVPMGKLSTYGHIGEQMGNPKATRAIGTAIGNNPVAFLIPCHRVIRSSGEFGEYHWGNSRKVAMIGWEAAKTDLINRNDL
ncbi:bifunctional helix-turn-helix domain-containing protein/methylated-DNA--[protein]-cysteine S-methyltransferase [Leptospira licerasiae]|uniref:Methylated-DNA--[protein]-cysteine S-methyltransferase n=1 Tax=Leptospira licerasiae str. MMD4847 TaxID=1049971 RepID=A0ABN0H452_9LEPT|nr:methylated-DNA--[protein]-cysteine S-methyltransferase [Leptospira licerasiae]EIE02730.1 DNA-binding helix-turn-helix domain / methylated-DNA--[protein]-cysteine S-methyltransferase multi-domain protein [Leptospira licerasiae serovar Varillal str. VAR 010]EJZ40472.1 methylated-DNA--[protein]-cysteine S-methyltransferase [Leptospira licerasiae str. MMD4847]